MSNKKSIVRIAKNKATTKEVQPITENTQTKINSNDQLAKKRVEELLNDVDLLSIKKENTTQPTNKKNVEWLEEELDKLTKENTELKRELELIDNQSNNVDDDVYKTNILKMFIEIQNNFIGNNKEQIMWRSINIDYLLPNMINLFPFLEEYKRF